jgi:hypothetical protein
MDADGSDVCEVCDSFFTSYAINDNVPASRLPIFETDAPIFPSLVLFLLPLSLSPSLPLHTHPSPSLTVSLAVTFFQKRRDIT